MAALLVGVVAYMIAAGGAEVSTPSTTRDPGAVAAGEALYNVKCAVCHGPDLRGTQTGPPFLDPTYAPNHHADEAFQRAVRYGVQPHHWSFGPMAPVPDTTREEVAQIVAYIRSVQEANGILFDPRHP